MKKITIIAISVLLLGGNTNAELVGWHFDLYPAVSGDSSKLEYVNVVFDTENYRFPPIVRDNIVIINWLVDEVVVDISGTRLTGEPRRLPPFIGAIGLQKYPDPGTEVLGFDIDLEGGYTVIMNYIAGPIGTLTPYYEYTGAPRPLGDLNLIPAGVLVFDETGNLVTSRRVKGWYFCGLLQRSLFGGRGATRSCFPRQITASPQ